MISNSPKSLAFCSFKVHTIGLYDLQKGCISDFTPGIQLKSGDIGSWTQVKEVAGTNLMISLHHVWGRSANFEVFDVAKGKLKRIFTFSETDGRVGYGEIVHNIKRNLLAMIPLSQKVSYHLFNITENSSDPAVSLLRKSKWLPSQNAEGIITGFDINLEGSLFADMDNKGNCHISEIDTQNYVHYQSFGNTEYCSRCRWTLLSGSPRLYIKYSYNKLNVLDIEKKALLFSDINLEVFDSRYTIWIEPCPTDPNLLAAVGQGLSLKIFDQRTGTIVRVKERLHEDQINNVQWDREGKIVATCSLDGTVKVTDFGSEKVLHKTSSVDGGNSLVLTYFLN